MPQTVETTTATTELTIVAEQAQLPAESQRNLLDSFQPHYQAACDLIEQARNITVTDATQLTEMKQARTIRLALKDVRVSVDKARKSLKEESLRTGKAIDGMANVLKYMIEPAENRLDEMEKFAERAEAERKANLQSSRLELLAALKIDSSFYDLANMPESTFATLLDTTRLAHESRIAAAKKAEDDRIAAEQARIEEEKRVRAENAKLQREAEEQAKALAAERAKVEADRKAADDAARAEREAIERKAEAARKEAEATARAEREALQKKAAEERERLEAAAAIERRERERLQAEAKAKADTEARVKRDAEAAKKKAAKAPDKIKLLAFAAMLRVIELPSLSTDEGQEMIASLVADLYRLADRVTMQANHL